MNKIRKHLSALRCRLNKEFFICTHYSIAVNPYHIARRGLYKEVLHLADKITGKTLDFGCGSKPYQELFTQSEYYVGIDVQKSGHNHANSKIDIFFDGETIPIQDNSFDSIVSFQVLEHVFDIDAALTEMRRILKPEGLLLITVPFAWDEHETPYDFKRYSSYGIAKVLELNSFRIISLQKTTSYILTIFQMLIAYLAQHISPQKKYPKLAFQFLIIFPLNLISLLINSILPKRYTYYCDNVVLAQKI